MSSVQSKKEPVQDYTVQGDGVYEIAGGFVRKGDPVSLRPSVAARFGAILVPVKATASKPSSKSDDKSGKSSKAEQKD